MILGAASVISLTGRLVGEEVAAVDRVVEVDLGRVALALRVHGAVDAALRADRVGALHRHEREEVDRDARLAELDRRHQAGEAAADDDDALFRGAWCHERERVLPRAEEVLPSLITSRRGGNSPAARATARREIARQ